MTQRISLVANGGLEPRNRRSGYLSLDALIVFGQRSSAYAGVLACQPGRIER